MRPLQYVTFSRTFSAAFFLVSMTISTWKAGSFAEVFDSMMVGWPVVS